MKLVKTDGLPTDSMLKAKVKVKGTLNFHQKDGSVISVDFTSTDLEVKPVTPAGEPHGDSR